MVITQDSQQEGCHHHNAKSAGERAEQIPGHIYRSPANLRWPLRTLAQRQKRIAAKLSAKITEQAFFFACFIIFMQ
ncbi:hypothetical protein [Mucilaginibacter sp.]|jgi:hypothetical protein|uniref:hypothetical protein n=1 Tax=Mucilaginibacter sp. TaxID=1882438 RepID=UPI003567B7FC